MFYMIAYDLVVLWLLGLLTSHTFGGGIHILPGVAFIIILVRIISGRRRFNFASQAMLR
jgi:hypothetical protein